MRAVLVERLLPHETSRLQELAALAETLDHEMVAEVRQTRAPDPAYHIGKGKAKELANIVDSNDAERVIFANPLKPSQAFKLEELVGVEVIDRFQLILEIFAMRAGSPEAKLQVEYAKLNYELPRVRELVRRAKLGEFPGLKGGGEYEKNVRVDDIKRRMNALEDKLKSLESSRQQRRERRRRRGFKLVAIAGYTNAGKSTLLNSISSADVDVDDRLFTTLSPRTRALEGTSRKVLLTDAVGFIDDLPPWLIEAFKAALEEVFLADLVLLVVDGSDPLREVLRKLSVSRSILAEHPATTVTLLNKVDLIPKSKLERRIEALQELSSDLIPISAKYGTNLDKLVDSLRSKLIKQLHVRLTIYQGSGVGKILHRVREKAVVDTTKFENPAEITFWTDERELGELRKTLDMDAKLEIIGDTSA